MKQKYQIGDEVWTLKQVLYAIELYFNTDEVELGHPVDIEMATKAVSGEGFRYGFDSQKPQETTPEEYCFRRDDLVEKLSEVVQAFKHLLNAPEEVGLEDE